MCVSIKSKIYNRNIYSNEPKKLSARFVIASHSSATFLSVLNLMLIDHVTFVPDCRAHTREISKISTFVQLIYAIYS